MDMAGNSVKLNYLLESARDVVDAPKVTLTGEPSLIANWSRHPHQACGVGKSPLAVQPAPM